MSGLIRRAGLVLGVCAGLLLGPGAGLASASSVTSVSVSANVSSAGATQVVDKVTFTATTAIAAGTGGFVELTGPTNSTFSGTRADYDVLDNGTNSQQPFGVSVSPSNVVDVEMPYAIAAGHTVEIDVYRVVNPAASGSDSFSVSTSSDTTAVVKSFSIGSATQLSNVSVSANVASAGATNAVYTADFKATTPLTAGNPAGFEGDQPGFVELTAPPGAVFSTVRADYDVIDGVNSSQATMVLVNPNSEGQNVVDVYVPFAVNAGDDVEIDAYRVQNPTSASPSAQLSLTSSSDATLVTKPFAITAAGAVTALSVSANSSSAGATQVVDRVTFKAANALTATNPAGSEPDQSGFVQLTGPTGSTFSSTRADYDVIDGVNSSQAEQVVVDPASNGSSNIVDVYVPFAINALDTVEIDAYVVVNPSTAHPSTSFSVSTSSDPPAVQTSFPIIAPSSPAAVSSAISDSGAGQTGVTYTIGVTVTGGLTAGNPAGLEGDQPGVIQLTAGAGAFFPASTSQYRLSDGSNSSQALGVTVSPGSVGNNIVDIVVPFTVPPGDQLTLTITGVTNPSPVANTAIAVSTSSDPTAAAASASTNVTATAGNVSASVSWTAPAASAGAVIGYIVTPFIGSAAQAPMTFDTADTSETIAGLRNGTTYTFEVAALSAAGTGPESAPSNSITPAQGANAPPGVGLSTHAVDFGAVGVGHTSASQTVTVLNTGTDALAVSNAGISGSDPGDFKLVSDTCAGQPVAGGRTCSVEVAFDPSAGGTRTAQLTLTDNASGSPHQVALSGTGTTSGTVSGRVLDGSRAGTPPILGAAVQICQQGTFGACQSGSTGPTGRYSFSGLEPGSWVMQIEPPSSTLFGASAVVHVVAGSQTQDFTLRPPVPLKGGVTFDTPGGTVSNGVPVINWSEPFTFHVPVSIPVTGPADSTQTLAVTAGFGAGSGSAGGGGFDLGGVVLFSVRFGPDGHALRMSPALVGTLQCDPPGGGPSPCAGLAAASGAGGAGGAADVSAHVMHVSIARGPVAHAAGCVGPGIQLQPNQFGGANLTITLPDGSQYTVPIVQLQIPPPPDTGNPLANATINLSVAAANTVINGAIPELGLYNTMVGVLGAVATATQPGATPLTGFNAGTNAGLSVVAQTLNQETHGASYWFFNIATGAVGGLSSPATPPPPPNPPCPPPPGGSSGGGSGGGGGSAWTDPSGSVLTTAGIPVARATVTLTRSPTANGPQRKVPAGSAIMSPGNRRNPDHTDLLGNFGWDVVRGFYRISASHPGCRAAGNPHGNTVLTKVLPIPPPITGLVLRLRCPSAARAKTTLRLSARRGLKPLPGYVLKATLGHGRGVARSSLVGNVSFRARASVLGTVALDPGTGTAILDVPAPRRSWGTVVATYSGNAVIAPSRTSERVR